jgi:hypothetical protein
LAGCRLLRAGRATTASPGDAACAVGGAAAAVEGKPAARIAVTASETTTVLRMMLPS